MNVSTQANSEVPCIPLYKLREVYNPAEIQGMGRRVFIELTEDEIYPSSHEDDMGETNLHYILNSYLWNALRFFFRERNDVFIAANMNLYYNEDNPQKWLAPDVMIAFGTNNNERRSYRLWQEKLFPQVIIEVASDSTWRNDIDEKLKIYEQLGAEEYYVVDSENYLPFPIMAYRREGDQLKLTRQIESRILSPCLGLEIVNTGTETRLFDPNKQEYLPTLAEASAKADAAQSEIKRLKAELARLKGES